MKIEVIFDEKLEAYTVFVNGEPVQWFLEEVELKELTLGELHQLYLER